MNERADHVVRRALAVSGPNNGNKPRVFHVPERAGGIGERDCETDRDDSNEKPGVVHHGPPFLERLRVAPCMSELYRPAIPAASPIG